MRSFPRTQAQIRQQLVEISLHAVRQRVGSDQPDEASIAPDELAELTLVNLTATSERELQTFRHLLSVEPQWGYGVCIAMSTVHGVRQALVAAGQKEVVEMLRDANRDVLDAEYMLIAASYDLAGGQEHSVRGGLTDQTMRDTFRDIIEHRVAVIGYLEATYSLMSDFERHNSIARTNLFILSDPLAQSAIAAKAPNLLSAIQDASFEYLIESGQINSREYGIKQSNEYILLTDALTALCRERHRPFVRSGLVVHCGNGRYAKGTHQVQGFVRELLKSSAHEIMEDFDTQDELTQSMIAKQVFEVPGARTTLSTAQTNEAFLLVSLDTALDQQGNRTADRSL